MKRWLLGIPLLVTVAHAQAPDVHFHFDLFGTFDAQDRNSGSLRFYDPLGDSSTIQIAIIEQNGFRGFLSERLQAFPHDPSKDPLEQYYVEDENIWRIGKQYLPFGSGTLIRENVLAAKGETNPLIGDATLQLAICDGGSGDQRGAVARFGDKFGASVAMGDHFGIAPTSLDLVRNPEDSPGSGRGWRQMYGLDGTRKDGKFVTSGETVWLTGGETSLDRPENVYDISESFHPDRSRSILAGFSHDNVDGAYFARVQATIPVNKNASILPLLRYRDGRFYDAAITLHVRL